MVGYHSLTPICSLLISSSTSLYLNRDQSSISRSITTAIFILLFILSIHFFYLLLLILFSFIFIFITYYLYLVSPRTDQDPESRDRCSNCQNSGFFEKKFPMFWNQSQHFGNFTFFEVMVYNNCNFYTI